LLLLLSAGALQAVQGERIGVPELARRLQASVDPPLVLDVRGRAAYLAGTIPGALDAGTEPAGFLPDGRGGAVVLVMSYPPDPERLAGWVRRLANAGHVVRLLEGGLPAWRRAGLAVETAHESFVRPGTVPFVIPRGLCEQNEPAQVFR
jgi:rhodanese-related sulfurtransferase